METLRRQGRRSAVAAAILGAVAMAFAFAPPFADATHAPDSRASAHDGNVTRCAQVGFPSATQLGGEGDAADAVVSGDVADHSGGGEELNVTLTKSGFVVVAVVVKGGPGYNLYTTPGILPPALSPPQRYIAPLVGEGNIPEISHWFVCYQTAPPPTTTTRAPTTTTTTLAPTAAAETVTVQPRLTG